MSKAQKPKGRKEDLVLLKDLAPRKDPKGGGKVKPVFGEHSLGSESALRPAPQPRPERRKR